MQSVAEKVESVAGAAMDLLQGNPFGTLVGQRVGKPAKEFYQLNFYTNH